jgi:methyl-accepting chemotaxis protein
MIWRVSLALIVAFGGGTAVSSLVSAELSQRTLVRVTGEETSSVAGLLAYEVGRAYRLDDDRGLSGFIDEIRKRRPEIKALRIVNAKGMVVASSDEAEIDKPIADDRFAAALHGKVPARFGGSDGEIVSVLVPIEIGRGGGGVLGLEQVQAALTGTLRGGRDVGIGLSFLTALLTALGLGWFLDRRVVRPVKELAAAARRMAGRDLSGAVPEVNTGDELGDLVNAFELVSQTTRGLLGHLSRLSSAMSSAAAAVGAAAREVRAGAAEQHRVADEAANRVVAQRATLERLGAAAKEAVQRAEAGGEAAGAIAEASSELVEVAGGAARNVEQSVQAIGDLVRALRGILDAAEAVRKANAASSAQAARVDRSSAEVLGDSAQAARVADELAEHAARGAATVARVVERIREVDDRIRTVDHHVDRLNPALMRISGIAQLMGEIADQTRVLSLNASILAARAGEAGAGFQVVAGKVRELAQLTRASASEITELVGSVGETAPVVQATVIESRESAAQGVALGAEAGAALDRILSGAQALQKATARIAGAAAQQAEAGASLLSSTADAAGEVDRLAAAADAQRSGTERLERGGEALLRAARAVDGKARHQQDLAEGIARGARADAAELRPLGTDALEGVASSRELQGATTTIVAVSERHAETLAEFERVLAILSDETRALGDEVATFRLPRANDRK